MKAIEIPSRFASLSVPYHDVSVLNWPEDYPYRPSVRVAAAYDDRAVLLHFIVSENAVRAVADADGGEVWKDSCVEFFASPADDGIYYNIECNCVGRLLVAAGTGRAGREKAHASVTGAIDRWASLGCKAFGLREDPADWDVALVIPFGTFFKHDVRSLDGIALRGNFYKCGDDLPVPHFVTYAPVHAPSPDYHRPESFVDIPILRLPNPSKA